MDPEGKPAAGFSLAEVVVGLGLLAGVLISVAGMLVLGSRLVNSGRSSSEALSVARDVHEEIGGWSFAQTYTQFSCDPLQPSCSVDTEHARAAEWRDRLAGSLHEGGVQILLESVDDPSLADARAIRVTVSVFWQDGLRARRVRLSTVRM